MPFLVDALQCQLADETAFEESYKFAEMNGGPVRPSRLSRFLHAVTDCFRGLRSAGASDQCDAAATTASTEDLVEVHGLSSPSQASPKKRVTFNLDKNVYYDPPTRLPARSILTGVSTGSMQVLGLAPAKVGASHLRVDHERKSRGALLSAFGTPVCVLDVPSSDTSRESSDSGAAAASAGASVAAADVPALDVAPVVHRAKTFTFRSEYLEMVSGLKASHVARKARTVWAGMAKAVPPTHTVIA
ncbi:hypothetical protein FOA52_011078 [Chlamydomonas sp. UWO 241]|nr:hypothetical protein FOA52_011078 [Chlamydomonas sp. UWO 241]